MSTVGKKVLAREYIFREGEEVGHFNIVMEGSVAIVIEVSAQEQETVVSNLGLGDVFVWSDLVSPHKATANGKALTTARLLAFDFDEIDSTLRKTGTVVI